MKDRYTRDEINAMGADDIYMLVKNEMRIPRAGTMGTPELKSKALAWLEEKGMLVGTVVVPPPAEGAAPDADADETDEEAEDEEDEKKVDPLPAPATNLVHVSYGGYGEDLAVAGKTIAQAFAQLRAAWNIDATAMIYLNGEIVENRETVVPEGSTLDFVRPAGQKG